MIKVGSSQKPDIREYTIVYAIDNVDFVKDMIKEETSFQKYIETGVPNLNKMAGALHEVAKECVRYAKIYWKNEDHDALTVSQVKLNQFGDIIKNSPYGPGIMIRRATGGEPVSDVEPAEYTSKIKTFTVPADKVKDYIKFRWQVNDRGGVDYETTEGGETITKRVGEGSNTDIQTIKKPNGDLIVGIYGTAEFTKAFFSQCEKLGLVTDPGTISVTTKKAGRSWDFVRKAMQDKFGDDGMNKKTGSANISKSKPSGKTVSVTITFEPDSYTRGSKLADAYVKLYNSTHKNPANIDSDNGTNINIMGIDQATVDKMTDKFTAKGIKFNIA